MANDVITVTATAVQEYNQLIATLASYGYDTSVIPAGVNTVELLKQFCLQTWGVQVQAITQSVEQVVGYSIVQPVDPTTTTAVANRVITDLTVAGGEATAITRGRLSFGTLAKGAVITSLIAALGVSTFAPAEGMASLQQLIEGLNPFTLNGDGENIPVFIDENGKTYLDEKLIESVRQQMISMGLFNERLSPANTVDGASISSFTCNDLNQVKQILYTFFQHGDDNYQADFKAEYTDFWLACTDEAIANALPPIENSFYYVGIKIPSNPASGATQSYGVYIIRLVKDPNTVLRNRISENLSPDMGWNTSPKKVSRLDQVISGNDRLTAPGYETTWYRAYVNFTSYMYKDRSRPYSDTGDVSLLWNSSELSSSLIASGDIISANSHYGTKGVLVGNLIPGGLPGFNPRDKVFADASKTIEELSPEWYIKNYKIPAPTDDNLENKTTLLPVSITNTNGLETPTTATSTDREGDPSDDAKDKIIEDLMTAIQGLLKDPTKPNEVITPTIEVGDSGDTPPYIPPLISGASNGLWTIYNPTLAEVQQFGGWLWSDSIIDSIRRQFASPIDGVIGFMSLYATPITGERKTIKAGYLSSPVSAKEVTNQYITIDCGNVEVPEYYHTAIDYTRSQVSIYLPFIGIVPLDASVVTGSTLNVTYRIDVLTGACLAQIKVIKRNSDAVMYTFTGNCAVQLPLTAGTYTGLIGTLTSLCSGAISAMSGNMIGVGASLMGMARSMGTNVQKSGALASNAGALGIRIPYLILTHPTAYDAFIYNQVYGYPTNIYQRLSDLGGYVRVKDIHLDTISCTKQELEMIYDKLHEGVILT